MDLLFLVNKLTITCGISTHLVYLIRELEKTYNYKIHILSGGGTGRKELEISNSIITVIRNFSHEKRSIRRFLHHSFLIIKYCRKNKIDIIHSHSHYHANMARIVGKLLRIPTIQTNHGLFPDIGILPQFNADHIIVVNEHIVKHLREIRFPEKRIHLIRYGLPESPERIASFKRITFLCASRMVKEKSIDQFLLAIAALPKSILENSDFIICGAGPEEQHLRQLCTELEISVEFHINHPAMNQIYLRADILVFPSNSDMEGFPVTILEGGMTGICLISSKFHGHESVLQDGVNCLLYSSGNVRSLELLMEKSYLELHLRLQLGKQLQSDIKKSFSIRETASQLIILYKEAIG